MEMKYYNASNNFTSPIRREPSPYKPYSNRMEVIVPETPIDEIAEESVNRHEELAPIHAKSQHLFGNFKIDDLLLLGLIILLVMDSTDDILLLLILGYLFMTGLNNEG